jgi:hypothetical protein
MPRANVVSQGLTDTWGRRNRLHADKVCGECGAVFRPKRGSSSYCSRPCARKKNGGQNAKIESWWLNGRGYIEGRIWTAQGHRKVKQHRFIMECSIGRLLRAEEDVHHINGNKTDNRLSNLELLSHGAHSQITNAERWSRAKATEVKS